MIAGGVVGLSGQPVLRPVEITIRPAQGHAQLGNKGQTAREKIPELRDAIIPVQVLTHHSKSY